MAEVARFELARGLKPSTRLAVGHIGVPGCPYMALTSPFCLRLDCVELLWTRVN